MPAVGNPTAGIVFGLMLELTRRIGFENARLKSGESWQVTIGRDLEGLTLGVVGLGKLGQRVAAIGKAFGMEVIAWSLNLTPEKAKQAAQIIEKKAEVMGPRAAKKTMLAKQVLQELNAGGRVSKKTQLAVDDVARLVEES